MSAPTVSVIMPVMNAEKYLEESLDSILGQTYKDFELIVVSEAGSTDRTDEILDSITDERLRVIKNERPLGLTRSLNRGMFEARGKYLARMDGDDIASPWRLEHQVRFLEANPRIGIAGTAVRFIDEEGKEMGTKYFPQLPGMVAWGLHFDCIIAHPSVMIRREVFEQLGGYSLQAEHVEDYDLWLRAMRVTDLSNLYEVLLDYRVHPGSASRRKRDLQERLGITQATGAMEMSIGRRLDTSLVINLLRPYSIKSPWGAVAAARVLYALRRAFLSNNRSLAPIETMSIKDDVSERMSQLIAHSALNATKAVPMLMWQACRCGPGVVARLPKKFLIRGKERLTARGTEIHHTYISSLVP
jgi:glycosyltransferase involved in cell wall biosynthesis